MHRNLLAAVALVAGPLLWASGAQAAQITFGRSARNITFTGNGAARFTKDECAGGVRPYRCRSGSVAIFFTRIRGCQSISF